LINNYLIYAKLNKKYKGVNKMKKSITIIRGDKIARFGGGFTAVAVNTETPDVYAFGFKSDAEVYQVEVSFDVEKKVGAVGDITGHTYEYNVFIPVFEVPSSREEVGIAIRHFCIDDEFQSQLNKEFKAQGERHEQ
jgi:hypothetical protein